MGDVQSKALKKPQGAGFSTLSAAGVFTQLRDRGPTLALKGSCGSRWRTRGSSLCKSLCNSAAVQAAGGAESIKLGRVASLSESFCRFG